MQAANDHGLGFRERLGYGLGDTASNFHFQTFNIFLLYYYTDVFGIRLLFTFIPAALAIFNVEVLLFYRLSDEQVSRIKAALLSSKTTTAPNPP